MPLYQLVCEQCGKEIEQLARLSTEKLDNCPDCQGVLRQRYGAPALFWGKGWGSAPFCFRRKFANSHSNGKLP